jgi:hypothetical protein
MNLDFAKCSQSKERMLKWRDSLHGNLPSCGLVHSGHYNTIRAFPFDQVDINQLVFFFQDIGFDSAYR